MQESTNLNLKQNRIKITDIDLWMNGNRHCIAEH